MAELKLVKHENNCRNTGACVWCHRGFSTDGPPYETHYEDENSVKQKSREADFYCEPCALFLLQGPSVAVETLRALRG